MPGVGMTLRRRAKREPFLGSRPASQTPTLHVVVGFAAGHPLAPLETPVIRVRQHHLHEDVVVGRGVEAGDVKAQEREHPPGEGRETMRGGSGNGARRAPSVPAPRRPRRQAASPRLISRLPSVGKSAAAFRGKHPRAGGTTDGEGAHPPTKPPSPGSGQRCPPPSGPGRPPRPRRASA